MSIKNSIKAIPLRTLASSAVSGTYALLTAASGLSQPCFYLRINNASNQDITVSFDGTTDQEYVLASDVLTIPVQTQIQAPVQGAAFARGTKIFVKGTAGTGSIYLSGYYTSQGA